MISSKSFKILLFFTLVCASSCRYWQTSSNSNTNVATPTPEIAEINSEIPFATKEPETFQAEIIIKNEGEEEKTFIARSNGRTLSKNGDLGTLQVNANKSFLINFAKKIYVENTGKTAIPTDNAAETLNDFLTTEWLNQKTETKFENLGIENGLTKYRATLENSESLIFVDENYKIPIKQEFYSIDSEAKNLVYSIELQNLKLIAEENLFEIPNDFRKVSIEEFRQNLKHNE
ncbi:MAG: hypothetical protein K1X72_26315 [Pyrinomonadaceae bacterium]|nr:hypothetical protein [Pyrinomonadaceae bacterium]